MEVADNRHPASCDNILATKARQQPQATMLVLQRITNGGGTQMRASMDPETIKEYQEAIRPSGTWRSRRSCHHDGDRYWLGDGSTRSVNATPQRQIPGYSGRHPCGHRGAMPCCTLLAPMPATVAAPMPTSGAR